MKKKTIILATIILSLGCIGTLQAFTALEKEEPQEIRGIIMDEHDSLWYETQQRLWLQKAEDDPTDEHAWQQAVAEADRLLNDPQTAAEWQTKFNEQKQTSKKPYRLLRNYVIATITKQIEENQQ